jgi:hypothetical protein
MITFMKIEFSSQGIARKIRASIEIISLYKHKRSLVKCLWIWKRGSYKNFSLNEGSSGLNKISGQWDVFTQKSMFEFASILSNCFSETR